MKREVIVVTAAYGRQQIAAMGGQQIVVPIVASAGADGIEIRRELFSDSELSTLPALGKTLADTRLVVFYSVPEALFTNDGQLNPRIDVHFAEAKQLNAQRLKYSLGHYHRGFDHTVLHEKLAGQTFQLVIENDQSECGKLSALENYFRDSGEPRPCCGMAFDIGNWLWLGDDPLVAAESLNRFVSYIHVKAATKEADGWRAMALDEADNVWRETLALLPSDVPCGIEFPLEGDDLQTITRHYVDLLREE